jgi:hypothetical protein
MPESLLRSKRPFGTGLALALAAVAGWSGFAYSEWSSGQQVTVLTAEREAAVADRRKPQEAVDSLKEVEAKLGAARIEHSRVAQEWTETTGKLGAAQQELAVLSKRLDQARDRVSQTGSTRPEPPKPPARKP